MAALTCSIHGLVPGELTGCPYCASAEKWAIKPVHSPVFDVEAERAYELKDRRERIATAVFARAVAVPPAAAAFRGRDSNLAVHVAKMAVYAADCLIAELDKA